MTRQEKQRHEQTQAQIANWNKTQCFIENEADKAYNDLRGKMLKLNGHYSCTLIYFIGEVVQSKDRLYLVDTTYEKAMQIIVNYHEAKGRQEALRNYLYKDRLEIL